MKPLALGRSKASLADRDAILGGPDYGRWLEEQKLDAVMQKLSESTRHGYESAWRQWVAYRALQERSPVLEGRDREERRKDEEDFITFAVYLAKVFGRTYSTLQQKLYAIRYAHPVAGYNNPVLHIGSASGPRWPGLEAA